MPTLSRHSAEHLPGGPHPPPQFAPTARSRPAQRSRSHASRTATGQRASAGQRLRSSRKEQAGGGTLQPSSRGGSNSGKQGLTTVTGCPWVADRQIQVAADLPASAVRSIRRMWSAHLGKDIKERQHGPLVLRPQGKELQPPGNGRRTDVSELSQSITLCRNQELCPSKLRYQCAESCSLLMNRTLRSCKELKTVFE